MAAEQKVGSETSIVVTYPVSAADIEAKRAEFAALSFDTPKAYAEGVKGIAHLRDFRGQIEDRRVYLKADSLAYGRAVDAAAKQLFALVLSIEEPLKAKKKLVDDEKARIKREQEQAELRAIEAKLKAEREAEEARLRAEREAEQARLAEEQKRFAAERAKFAEERRKADEARAAETAELRRQQAEVDAQRRVLEAERRKVQLEQEAREQAERAKVQAEVDRLYAEGLQIIEDEHRAQLLPDLVKLEDFAHRIRTTHAPSCGGEARQIVDSVVKQLGRAAAALDAFVARSKS